MTVLPRRLNADEHMDRPDVDPAVLAEALEHVAAVNRWLGGTRALLRHLPEALPDTPPPSTVGTPSDPGPLRLLDVGTGSGDLPLAVSEWARSRNQPIRITAVDLHQGTLAVAARKTAATQEIALVRGDGLRLPFATGSFDVALLSMTLHHMDGPALVAMLRELARATRGGTLIVAELERCLPNYLGAKLMAATVWRRNAVTRHDGPLSVLRAFTPAEMVAMAREAGLGNPRVRRRLFYRLVLVADA